MDKLKPDFQKIASRINQMVVPEVEHVVGIATGGIVPAGVMCGCSLSLIRINYLAEITARSELFRRYWSLLFCSWV
jgi:hypoxanthine phosphoribosyltransferase